jgi:uncharacterized protein with NRDE domain
MCLVLFAYKCHHEFPIVVAANRDEFYDRPTEPMYFWDDYPQILAGRDLKEMGTWMGVTTTGKFAALTNFRNPRESNSVKTSRGVIVANFLKEDWTVAEYAENLKNNRFIYNGYNVIFGNQEELYYYSNVSNDFKKLKPGIYGVSNHLLDSPWPKVRIGKQKLSACINEGKVNDDYLFSILESKEKPLDWELPDTGVGTEWERTLSPIFISSEMYGTRASTIVKMSTSGQVEVAERSRKNELKYFSFHIKN